ncbi:MAG: hypothetical protein Cons2KO_14390 [Congregibacter sp.]
MYLIAKIYPTDGQARAAADAVVSAGYDRSILAVLPAQTAASQAAPAASMEAMEGAVESAPAEPAAASNEDAVANAIRVGRMLGENADFYLSELTDSRSMVVARPHFLESRRAEMILDEYNPLPISHRPASEPFRPISEQAAPLSDALGLPVLSDGVIFSVFESKQDGLSHFSRWFPPLAPSFTFSKVIGMGFQSKRATPLSSMLGFSTKSRRLEGKSSSFGFPLKSSKSTTFLGMFPLTKRKHFLTW